MAEMESWLVRYQETEKYTGADRVHSTRQMTHIIHNADGAEMRQKMFFQPELAPTRLAFYEQILVSHTSYT